MENQNRECKYRRKCGACQTLNLSYEQELSLKMKREIELLGRFCHVEEIIPSEPPIHYRNKAQYLFRYTHGRIQSGLYRSSDGGIANIDECLMEDLDLTRLYLQIKKLIQKSGVKVYDGRNGDLRHVMIRKGVKTGELSVTFVTRNGLFDNAAELADEITKRFPGAVCISAVKNDTKIPLWMNGEEYLIKGDGYIKDVLCGCKFNIPPKAFYQINPYSTEKLYKTAATYAQITESDNVLDAYCGIGTVGITAAKNGCASLDGFDINPDAAETAKLNALQNGIENCDYKCVSDSRYILDAKKHYNVVFTDPPRSGCDRRFIGTLLKLLPDRIVYISCDPQTLARDLRLLAKSYKIKKIQPVDMFPGTRHVESVVKLIRQ